MRAAAGAPVQEPGRLLLSGAQGIDGSEGEAAEMQLVDNCMYFENILLCCISAYIPAAPDKNCIKAITGPASPHRGL